MRPSFTPLALTLAPALALALALASCSAPDRSLLTPVRDAGGGAVDTGTPAEDTGPSFADAAMSPDSPVTVDAPTDDTPSVDDVPVDVPPAVRCGDGICTAGREDCTSCPQDCGVCPPRCGDGVCSAPRETCISCPRDCGACDMCDVQTTCGTCTPVNNCGWCKNSGRCLTGTMSGPTDRSCTSTQWAWTMNQCDTVTDPCSAFDNCTLCAGQSTCGWCANNNRCLTGTTAGPNDGACHGSDWRPTPMTCSGR